MNTPYENRKPVICRACHAQCALYVETDENDQIIKTHPIKDNPAYYGYSCIKGREFANNHLSENRLLNSRKKSNGVHEPINWKQAASEIGSRY